MPKAVPDAPLGALARQWYADADVETAVAIASPTNAAKKKRLIDCLPEFMHEILDYIQMLGDIYAATFRIAFMRFSFLRPPQYFATFLLLANVPKSTTGMFRSALK